MVSFRALALEANRRGFFSVLPVEYGSKNPLFPVLPKDTYGNPSWAAFQHRETTREEIEEWARQAQDCANIGWAMGSHVNRVLFDVDPRHGGLESWQHLTRGEDVSTFMVNTHDSGFHAYFEHPGYAFKLEGKWPGIDVRSDNTYGVGAGSLHPSGIIYTPRNTLDVAAMPPCLADWLRPLGEKDPGFRRALNPALSLKQALAVFEKCDRKRDQYEMRSGYDAGYDYAVIQTLANMGCSPDLMLEAFDFTPCKSRYRQRVAKRGQQIAQQELLTMYEHAITAPDAPHYEAVGHNARLIRQLVMQQPWSGVAARSEQAVLLAHVTQYEDVRVAPWDVSVRSLSEIAKMGKNTVSRTHERLQRQGWLKRYPQPYRSLCLGDAFEFGERLTDRLNGQNREMITLTPLTSDHRQPLSATPISGAVAPVEEMIGVEDIFGKNLVGSSQIEPKNSEDGGFSEICNSEKAFPNNPNIGMCSSVQHSQERIYTPGQTATFGVFEKKALGKSAERIWLTLQHHSFPSANQLAVAAQLHRSTVSRLLPKMSGYGIVLLQNYEIRLNPNCDFEAIGQLLDTLYIDQKRKDFHAWEREIHDYSAAIIRQEIARMKQRVKAKKARERKRARAVRKQQKVDSTPPASSA